MRRRIYLGLVSLSLVAFWGCSDDDDGGGGSQGGSGGTAGQAGAAGAGDGGRDGGVAGGRTDGGGGRRNDGGDGGPRLTTPVNVIITADNAYSFGYGTRAGLTHTFGGVENPGTDDIFACPIGNGPESYTVPAESANAGNYLYIIGYADELTTQGVIAQFFREGAAPVYTGMGPWEACATGRDYGLGAGGPTLEVINEYIGLCNAGTLPAGTSSRGWVSTTSGPNGNVAFGENNLTEREAVEPGNEFKRACDIDEEAQWMWYDWDPATPDSEKSPFIWPGGDNNPMRDFIIFRLGAEFVPEVPE